MKRFITIFMLILTFGLIGCTTQQTSSSPSSFQPLVQGIGHVGDTLAVPTGLTLRLIAVQQKGQQWLFHFHAQNNTHKVISFIRYTDANFQFYVSSQGMKLISTVSANQQAYPALPSSLSPQASADGWVASSPTTQPNQILYR